MGWPSPQVLSEEPRGLDGSGLTILEVLDYIFGALKNT